MSDEKLVCMKCNTNERQESYTKCRRCIQDSQNRSRRRLVSYNRELEEKLQSLQKENQGMITKLEKENQDLKAFIKEMAEVVELSAFNPCLTGDCPHEYQLECVKYAVDLGTKMEQLMNTEKYKEFIKEN